ncbi:hypothetical protein [Enterococcus sp. NPDC086594]|uniref:hypothetical protein n=1 Tax=Enterococcus sp. NPDC086594 TaxID=3363992 RepID=UPI0038147D29
MVLNAYYKVQLTPETNVFGGDEADIRQLLYDFYFTLPVYPDSLTEKINQMRRAPLHVKIGTWRIDKQQLNEWGNIAKLRTEQGHELPQRNDFTSLQTSLAQAFDRQITSSLPNPEKAALFLLTLDENQFLDPLIQEMFLRNFPMTDALSFLVRENEGIACQFLEHYLALMRHFFRLTPLYNKECDKEIAQDESLIFTQLMNEFLSEKEHYKRALYINYHLKGSTVLKRWIQEEVEAELSKAGLEVVETQKIEKNLYRQLEVSNYPRTQLTKDTVILSKIPRKQEIQQALGHFFRQEEGEN